MAAGTALGEESAAGVQLPQLQPLRDLQEDGHLPSRCPAEGGPDDQHRWQNSRCAWGGRATRHSHGEMGKACHSPVSVPRPVPPIQTPASEEATGPGQVCLWESHPERRETSFTLGKEALNQGLGGDSHLRVEVAAVTHEQLERPRRLPTPVTTLSPSSLPPPPLCIWAWRSLPLTTAVLLACRFFQAQLSRRARVSAGKARGEGRGGRGRRTAAFS